MRRHFPLRRHVSSSGVADDRPAFSRYDTTPSAGRWRGARFNEPLLPHEGGSSRKNSPIFEMAGSHMPGYGGVHTHRQHGPSEGRTARDSGEEREVSHALTPDPADHRDGRAGHHRRGASE